MRILFFGDIVGKKGREIVLFNLNKLKDEYKPDLIMANGENSAHGKGITYKIYNQLINSGIDVITLGNHAFSKSEMMENIDLMDKLICPINHEAYNPKCLEAIVKNINGFRLCITNILGNVLISETNGNLYDSMEEIIKKYKNKCDAFLVDLHAETTAEKRVFIEYFKKKGVIAVIGTHTHVQTADECINDGCAFISDIGMCGPYESVLGRDIDECIKMHILKEATKYTVSENDAMLCAVVIDIDEKTKKATNIERIQIRPN